MSGNVKLPQGGPDAVQVLKETGTSESVTIGAASAANATAFTVNVVRVAVITADTCITFGTTPVAVTTDLLMPAGSVEYFHVTPGDKVAGISQDGATAGVLIVSEMA
jgi:hypothetical protein